MVSTDVHLHFIYSGSPNEDPPQTQRFLLCLTVGVKQKATVHALVQKVSQLARMLPQPDSSIFDALRAPV